MRWLLPLAVALLIGGCAETPVAERVPEPVVMATAKKPPPPPAPATSAEYSPDALRFLARHNLQPQTTRPLNVRSRCANIDAIGTETLLDLLVNNAEVQTFHAQVAIRGRGTCRFSLTDFDQVERLPQALLRHKRYAGCTVRLWEEGKKVTIAFNSCPRSCDRNAFSYLWPIMVEADSGRCF